LVCGKGGFTDLEIDYFPFLLALDFNVEHKQKHIKAQLKTNRIIINTKKLSKLTNDFLNYIFI
jgi:hypothetical protein